MNPLAFLNAKKISISWKPLSTFLGSLYGKLDPYYSTIPFPYLESGFENGTIAAIMGIVWGPMSLGFPSKKNPHVSITTHLPRLTSCFMRRMRQSRGQHILETPSDEGVQVVGRGCFKKAGNKFSYPIGSIGSMYGIFTNTFTIKINQHVGKYIIHRWCGYGILKLLDFYKYHVGHSRNLPRRIVNNSFFVNNGRKNDGKCMATKIRNGWTPRLLSSTIQFIFHFHVFCGGRVFWGSLSSPGQPPVPNS